MKRSQIWLGLMVLGVVFLVGSLTFAGDKLVVKNGSGQTVVKIQDEGRVMAGGENWTGVSWTQFYGLNPNGLAGIELRSYADASTRGGGALFSFFRGSEAAPEALRNGDRLGFFLFAGYDGGQMLKSVGMTAKVDGPVSDGNLPAKITFETNPEGYPRYERMSIGSEGTVTIGNGSHDPAVLLQVGNAYCDGNGWLTASSRDFKEDIEKLDPAAALAALDRLEPVTFRYKEGSSWQRKRIGFIAEDLPESLAVPGKKAIADVDILATLTRVVKEQQKQIRQLQSRLQDLEQ
jgi:hypothetical protein